MWLNLYLDCYLGLVIVFSEIKFFKESKLNYKVSFCMPITQNDIERDSNINTNSIGI
jgi:hypothetical protein